KGELRRSPSGDPAARYFIRDQSSHQFKSSDPTTYDGRAPVRDESSRLPLAKEVNHKIWGPMVEYTYAKFRNEQGGAAHSTDVDLDRTGYNRIANGGYPNHVMRALTGHDAETVNVDLHHEDALWNKLTAAQNNNQVVIVGSTAKDTLRDRVHQELE